MDKSYSSIDDILNDAEFGDLFESKVVAKQQNADDRLIESFEEINKFVDSNGHKPNESKDINERRLFARLKALNEDEFKSQLLKEYDRHNLLPERVSAPQSFNDILKDSIFDSRDDSSDIFSLKHVKHSSERARSDLIARRRVCKNFGKYEQLFKQCQADIKSGTRKLVTFHESNLLAKTFFVVNGVLGYLETIYNLEKDKNSKFDGRTYCLFENGTESNMLFRSLGKILYDNGKLVSATQNEFVTEFNSNFNLVTEEDNTTGYIYVLRSKSKNPKISEINNLYKIGYSTTPVEDRIKNASQEPTYLIADVESVNEYQCYNLDPQKFEKIIHAFFGKACLNLDIFGVDGKRYSPREWFIVPLPIIEKAIQLIIAGKISDYYYDEITQRIELLII